MKAGVKILEDCAALPGAAVEVEKEKGERGKREREKRRREQSLC